MQTIISVVTERKFEIIDTTESTNNGQKTESKIVFKNFLIIIYTDTWEIQTKFHSESLTWLWCSGLKFLVVLI
jgi:hypothetical protein